MGNAGTAMRLFTGLLSAQSFRFATDRRCIAHAAPHGAGGEAVARNGGGRAHRDGTPPVDIGGGRRLHGIEYHMPVASAQVKSAILLAALYADAATTVIAPAVTRDHSERMLAELRRTPRYRRTARPRLYPPQALASQRLEVPGDFSSAAFFIVAGLLGAPTRRAC